MPSTVFSNDVWDYLSDMPYLPSRRDRDELRDQAMKNPKLEKRLQIWDYFFHIRSADVGKPQKQAIDSVTREKDKQITALRTKMGQQIRVLGIAAGVLAAAAALTYRFGFEQIAFGVIALVLLDLLGIYVVWQQTNSKISKAIRNSNEQVAMLQKQIVYLQRQVPEPTTVEQMRQWLEEDIDWLTKHALAQTGLENKRVMLDDQTPNPICIIGPGYLQRNKAIPELLLDPREVDRNKHLAASRLDFISNDRFVDLYGVYYVEFIIVAEEVLGNYGCFWDFISGRIYNEHTAELYYNDVVALSTRQQFRKVDLSFFKMVLENAPTFSLVLSSGDSIQVTYASSEYIRNWHRMLTMSPNGEFAFDLKNWVGNPEVVAEKAVKALRKQLRRRKGSGVEGEARAEVG
ncbi:MAG: hypothetical protein HZB31_11380 [Nitrospirae bacterium]|nr:hypothetical protein [Nitrospirota bacterium]